LILSGNTLYGTTYNGGLYAGNGTVFAIQTNGIGFSTLQCFPVMNYYTNYNGANPYAGLILSGNTLYGTAYNGGSTGNGTVFKVNINGTGFSILHIFAAGNSIGLHGPYGINSDGVGPAAGLILSGSTLYGTAVYGGNSGNGTVFAVNTDGTGFTTLHSFAAGNTDEIGVYTNSDGAQPYAGLILSSNILYGTTSTGSSSGYGTVFSLSLLAPPPQLTIIRSATNVILTWPTNVAGFNYAGFTLQFATNLVSSAVWNANLPSPAVVNGQNVVTNPISGTQQFFRLSQ
jgi:uncharacterized repeat protein (TIGR03803 family)